MTHHLRRLAAIVVAVCVLGLGLAGLAEARSVSAKPPQPGDPRPVIVKVTGDAETGFGIKYANGHSSFPPTASQARALCREDDQRATRVRCRAEAATWYRDLGDLQASLAWVRSH